MSWFKKKLPEQSQQQGIQLSPNFAEELMYLELEIESPNVSIDTISKLLELYRQAVEYFSSIKDDKYLIFKNKSQSVLLRPNVSQLLNSQEAVPQNEEPTNNKNKKKEIEQQLSQQDSYAVQRFLHNERNSQDRRKSMIDSELSMQDTRIAERMLKRVKDPTNLLKKSASLNSLQKLHLMAFDHNLMKAESANCLDKEELHKIQEERHDDNTPQKKFLQAESGIQKQFCKTSALPESKQIILNNPNYNSNCRLMEFTEESEQFGVSLLTKNEENDLVIKQPNTQYLVQRKEKKIREMVSNSKALSQQKSRLLQHNDILPF